jgi:LacI family transcriptional regulator
MNKRKARSGSARSEPKRAGAAAPGGQRQATVVDVAEVAGVAVGTVSRYINGHAIRTGNRDRIERAIANLGYRRNAVASAMKTDVTHMVGFLVPSLSEFHAGLLEQLSHRMRRTGRAVISYSHDLDPHSIVEGLEFFASHRVDAVVMDGSSMPREQLVQYADAGLNMIFYDNDVEGIPADRVFVENRKASARAVNHLIELGHERVATITGSLHNSAGALRYAGYRDALSAHGLPVEPQLVVEAYWKEAQGYSAARELFSLPRPPTAIFSANYNMTMGMLAWMREHDLRTPRDVSLVSFDDIPAFTVHEPGITAVGQPVGKIADAITTLLATRFASPAMMGRHTVTIDCDIILRGSTRRLARLQAVGGG